MDQPPTVLAIADDPLLRKAISEVLTTAPLSLRIEPVSPARASRERISAADIVVLLARDGDAATVQRVGPLIDGVGRPVILVAVGSGGLSTPIAGILDVPDALIVTIRDLDIRGELERAGPALARALNHAETLIGTIDPRGTNDLQTNEPTASPPPSLLPYTGTVICIGASTGGTEALVTILAELPPTTPPIVIVQHMPDDYVQGFAARLARSSTLDVETANDRLPLRRGLAVVAPGGRQLRLFKDAGGIWTVAGEADRIGGHCPAVDVLMESAAAELGNRAIGIILTGMGRDGADGLLAMRRAGARTVAQDEGTCVVYGMPKAAAENGGASRVLPLDKIADWIAGQAVRATD